MKDRRPHTAPTGPQITSEPRLNRARDHCRRALKHYRAADQSADLFDFHVSVKNKNIRPISDRPFCFFLNVENVTAATVFAVTKRDNKAVR